MDEIIVNTPDEQRRYTVASVYQDHPQGPVIVEVRLRKRVVMNQARRVARAVRQIAMMQREEA